MPLALPHRARGSANDPSGQRRRPETYLRRVMDGARTVAVTAIRTESPAKRREPGGLGVQEAQADYTGPTRSAERE
jgi:hypothetical protein